MTGWVRATCPGINQETPRPRSRIRARSARRFPLSTPGFSTDAGRMCDLPQLRGYLEEQLPAALDLLREMVGINSFTGNREGVNRLGRLTAERFRPLGFQAEFVPRPTRMGRPPGDDPARRLRQRPRHDLAPGHGVSSRKRRRATISSGTAKGTGSSARARWTSKAAR